MPEQDDKQAEPITAFACGGDKCPKGGEHKWSDELQEIGEGAMASVCVKCGMDAMSYSLWNDE